MTVYDSLEKRHTMPRAWEDWADYRREWSRWVRSGCERGASMLIVGAGACNDYELASFCEYFEKIYLLDLEEAPMQEGVRRVPADRREGIELLTGDFLGIKPAEYRSFCAVVQETVNRRGKTADIRELAELALPLLDGLYAAAESRRKRLILPRADYVAVSGVHSQVNHMPAWIWDAYMHALGQREETVFRRISEENGRIMRQMNELLLAAAGRGLFVCAEKARAGVPGGVEGAWQALADFKRRAEEKTVVLADTKSFAWGYDPRQGMIYEMEGLALTAGSGHS